MFLAAKFGAFMNMSKHLFSLCKS